MDNEVKNEQGQEQTPSTQEKTYFKAFETEDEFNKYNQSLSSKAKGEILKEVGFNSVSEIKERIAQSSKVLEVEEANKSLQSEHEKLLGEFDLLKTSKTELEDKLLVTKYNVSEEFSKQFITLVRSGVDDKVTLDQSAEQVITLLQKNPFKSGGKIVKIGSQINPNEMTDPFLEKARAAMRLSNKK